MASPFPGVDPFLEGQEWPDFHHRFITAIADALQPLIEPDYLARIGERVYVEQLFGQPPGSILPDVAVLEPVTATRRPGVREPTDREAPFVLPLPMPEEVRESYLEVRRRDTRAIVTVIEVLSPTNKRPGSTGREEYLAKRRAVLASRTHLVELDLLRGGERMPTTEPLPPADYYLTVSRATRRPLAGVWAFTIRDPVPVVPVPLSGDEAAAQLGLQTIFTSVYEAARYSSSLDYRHGTLPPLSEDDAAWAQAVIGEPTA